MDGLVACVPADSLHHSTLWKDGIGMKSGKLESCCCPALCSNTSKPRWWPEASCLPRPARLGLHQCIRAEVSNPLCLHFKTTGLAWSCQYQLWWAPFADKLGRALLYLCFPVRQDQIQICQGTAIKAHRLASWKILQPGEDRVCPCCAPDPPCLVQRSDLESHGEATGIYSRAHHCQNDS